VVTILIESIIGCILFTLVIFIMMRNPINMIHDYPPAIQNKAKELGIIKDWKKRYSKTDIIRKIFAIIVFDLILAFVVYKFN